jgi:hypothetical protein
MCVWDLCHTTVCIGFETMDCAPFGPNPVEGFVCAIGYGPCNLWIQNCVADEKCSPTGSDTFWDWPAECQPGMGEAGPGDPCTIEDGIYSGEDDCEKRAMCWDVDPVTLEGTCVPLCRNNPIEPECPEGDRCVMTDPMDFAVCLPPCDPFAPGCTPDQLCTAVGENLACVPAAPVLAGQGEACEHPNDCVAGLACIDGSCAAFCDLDLPLCPGNQTCERFYGFFATPPGLEHVGLCE